MKRFMLLGMIFLAVFAFFMSFGSAGVNNCVAPKQVIFSLYDATNSHGTVNSEANAQYKICYEQIFGQNYTGSDSTLRTCFGNNKIARLTGTNNAHAEIPTRTSAEYSTQICYGDLTCRVVSGTGLCDGTNEFLVAALSDIGNAHLSASSGAVYGQKICCTSASYTPVVDCSTSPNPFVQLNPFSQSYYEQDNVPISATAGYLSSTNARITQVEFFVDGVSIGVVQSSSGAYSTVWLRAGGGTHSIMATATDSCRKTGSNTRTIIINYPVVPTIDSALWLNASNPTLPLYGAPINENIILYGETTFPLGTQISVEVYNKSNPYRLNRILENTKSGGSKTIIQTQSNNISYFTNNQAKIGDILYFKLVYSAANAVERQSNNFTVLPPNDPIITNLGPCEEFKDANTCNGAAPESSQSLPAEIVPCNGGKVNRCVWKDNKCHYNQTMYDGQNRVAGSCVSRYENLGQCINGKKKVDVNATYTAGTCSGGSCQSQTNVYIPCGRAVALLPFFTITQFIVAAVLIIIAYFIIFKTNILSHKRKR